MINYTEFITATINKDKMLSEERLDVAFSLFYHDGDGNIHITEL